MVTLEKRTISYLSVSARIRVIDPFSQMKLGYLTIIPRARMGSDSIAEWAIDSEAVRARGIIVLVKSN